MEAVANPDINIIGGLGDLILRCYVTDFYTKLDTLEGPLKIVVYSKNPYSGEIFDNHPKRSLMEVETKVYKGPRPPSGWSGPSPYFSEGVGFKSDPVFHVDRDGQMVIDRLWPTEYVVIQPFSWKARKSLSLEQASEVVNAVDRMGYVPVVIGRRFEGDGPHCTQEPCKGSIINMVGQPVNVSINLIKGGQSVRDGSLHGEDRSWMQRHSLRHVLPPEADPPPDPREAAS